MPYHIIVVTSLICLYLSQTIYEALILILHQWNFTGKVTVGNNSYRIPIQLGLFLELKLIQSYSKLTV